MSLSNTSGRYGSVAKTLHWLTALLIFAALPLGVIANRMADDIRNPDIPSTLDQIMRTATLFSVHKTVGVTLFFVALLRILWAILNPKPSPLHPDRRAETFLAETVHWLLYGSLVLVPLTGWIHHAATVGFAPIWWPFGQSLPFVPKDDNLSALFSALHFLFVVVLVVSILLHVAGALKHLVIDRDQTLARMLPGRSAATPPNDTAHSPAPAMAALLIWALTLGLGSAAGLLSAPQTAPQASASAPAPASQWTVTDGQLDISIQQLGNTVTGQFSDWSAAITFDPEATSDPVGHVDVTIAIGSLTLGSVTDQAMGPDFFDTDRYPTARFVADITRSETSYVAQGPLTIRDATIDASLPFDLTLTGPEASMTGQLQLDRMAFGIGATTPDQQTLGHGVTVNVQLQATRSDTGQ